MSNFKLYGYNINMDDSQIGVGPHNKPWPEDNRYDQELLANGDRRNVIDKYRYWTVDAIKDDLDKNHFDLQIAVENWQNDFNIGTIVRNANAFNVGAVHIIGRHHWNRRGAMVTDRYLNIIYHESVSDFVESVKGWHLIAIDNLPGAQSLSKAILPNHAILIFGGEGPGLSSDVLKVCKKMVAIEQFGSTRSVNVGVASGITMYAWIQQNVLNSEHVVIN